MRGLGVKYVMEFVKIRVWSLKIFQGSQRFCKINFETPCHHSLATPFQWNQTIYIYYYKVAIQNDDRQYLVAF